MNSLDRVCREQPVAASQEMAAGKGNNPSGVNNVASGKLANAVSDPQASLKSRCVEPINGKTGCLQGIINAISKLIQRLSNYIFGTSSMKKRANEANENGNIAGARVNTQVEAIGQKLSDVQELCVLIDACQGFIGNNYSDGAKYLEALKPYSFNECSNQRKELQEILKMNPDGKFSMILERLAVLRDSLLSKLPADLTKEAREEIVGGLRNRKDAKAEQVEEKVEDPKLQEKVEELYVLLDLCENPKDADALSAYKTSVFNHYSSYALDLNQELMMRQKKGLPLLQVRLINELKSLTGMDEDAISRELENRKTTLRDIGDALNDFEQAAKEIEVKVKDLNLQVEVEIIEQQLKDLNITG